MRTVEIVDPARKRRFACEIWYPAQPNYAGLDLSPLTQDEFELPTGSATRKQRAVREAQGAPGEYPLAIYSHSSGRWNRRLATYLTTHLASHGYVVAALDHSETVAAELAPRAGESDQQRAARGQAMLDARVPDVQFLLDALLGGTVLDSATRLDAGHIGIVGHSFGGWTALAAVETERRIGAVVALAPAGTSNPRPGILPGKLTFEWGRNVPTLYLVAENDIMTTLEGMTDLFERTRATKQMIVLRRADHLHFMDSVELEHETARAMQWPAAMEWMAREMRPVSELASGDQAHTFTRGLTLAHLDAVLRTNADAGRFLKGDVILELEARGIDAFIYSAAS